jgi:iron(III) transport system permease protein
MAVGLFVTLLRTPVYGTLWILLIAYAVRYFPYGQRGVSASIVSVAAELEESSRMSGAGWLTTMRRILLPLLRPGIVAAWLLLFITFMREVSMSMLLARNGTETLSSALFSLLGNDPTGASSAFTLVQVAMTLVVAVVFLRVANADEIRV